MNQKSVTIKSEIILSLLSDLERRELQSLRNKLLLALPERFFRMGSELWWERSELEADEDIKHGRVSKGYDNADELIADLHKGIFRKA